VRGAERSSQEPKIFSAVQEHCPPEKPFAIRYSPLLSTTHHPLPFYQSLIAAVSQLADLPISRFADKFGSAGASPSQFIPSPVPRPTTRSVSVPCPVPMVTNLFGEGGEGDANEGA
jgi:hypothetical protein